MKKPSSGIQVLFITRAYPPGMGGMQRFAGDFYKSYRQLGNIDLIANTGGKLMLVPFLLRAVLQVSISSGRYDVIHLYDAVLSPLIPLIRALSGAKVSLTVNGLDIVYPRFGYQKIVPSFVKRADQVFAISEQTRKACTDRGVPAGKVTVIPVGISPRSPEICSAAGRAAIASKFNIPMTGRLLLTVGRLVKRKGHAWFVSEVLTKLPKEYVYLIAGAGPEQEAIASRAREVGLSHRVHLLGAVSETEKNCLYQMARVFVMPNIVVQGDQEGFGIVALEAGLSALPVIASNVEGIRDAVIDGKTGVLIKLGDAQAFRDAIINPGVDPAAIRDAVISNFDWSRIAERYLGEFVKLTRSQGDASG